jgi:hypothetical protein
MTTEDEIYLYEKIKKSLEYQIKTIHTNMEKINEIEEIMTITENYDYNVLSVYFSVTKKYYPDEIKAKYLDEVKEMVKEKIYSLCQHQYIEDELELPNEVMKKITYCEKCYHEIKK